MHVHLSNTRVRLNDADLLGEGGEARVYAWKDQAVKVFHPVDPASRADVQARVTKLEKLRRFPTGLPLSVLGPTGLALDGAGNVVGFAMPALKGAEELARLAQRRFREQQVTNEAVMGHFRSLSGTLTALHARKVVVGDLNDGNALFRPGAPQVFLIDADSMQFDGLPCGVGHERFLDPRLYGVDLLAAPKFDEGTDWYAFGVMLFSSLLYVHPFGGTHPRLGTLLRRAEARHPVMRDDVTPPRVAASWKTLSDDALHWFEQLFTTDRRTAPAQAVLEQRWATCSCGVVHARAVCPACHALGPVAARPVVRSRGRCTAKTVFETKGRVLVASLQGTVKFAWEHAGEVRREDGTLVLSRPLSPTERLGLKGSATWLSDGTGALRRLEQGREVERTQTSLRGVEPVFAASAAALVRQDQEWLVDHLTGTRLGQVLEGQTWLWVGERVGLGFYRAGGVTVAFLLKVGRAGLKQLEGVSWKGRVVAAHAVFDARHALLSVTAELGGHDVMHRWLIDEDGAVIGRCANGSAGHGAVLQGTVVLATDAGLVALKNDAGVLVEATSFPDTQPFVSAQDELLAQSDGSLVVVGPQEVLQLSLS